jgi:trans-aconitate methyltransferase
MSLVERALEQPIVYRLWQAPFVEQKLTPIRRDGSLERARRVLDVGCGPGTNTALFPDADYVGIDHNTAYIETARRRHGRRFVVADVTTYELQGEEPFDFILVNSLLHHIDDRDVTILLRHLRSLLSEEGRIHMIELVLPDRSSLPRLMAKWDRGKYARPLAEWRSLVGAVVECVAFEPFSVGVGPFAVWEMLYLKGAAPAAARGSVAASP